MTNKFTFSDDVKLDINGVIFEFDSTDLELLERLDKFYKESQEKADAVMLREDYIEALKETIQFTVDAIDEILGEGASLKIFDGTKVTLNKATDVMRYISEEVQSSRSKRINKYAPERAKRN